MLICPNDLARLMVVPPWKVIRPHTEEETAQTLKWHQIRLRVRKTPISRDKVSHQ